MKQYNQLYTVESNLINLNNPLDEYPFPQFRRNSYFSLNGKWNYKITKNPNDLANIENEIIVPFPIESSLSGVNKRLAKGEYIIYKKVFSLENDFIKKNTFLHFLGVDQKYKVILNNYSFDVVTPLSLTTKLDISKYIKKYNELIVIVQDNLDHTLPLGKQSKKPKGIFYTPFSGIYYPVFIESVEDDYIKDISLSTTLDTLKIQIDSSCEEVEILIKDNKEIISKIITNEKYLNIKIPNPILWSPDNPHLYNLEIKTKTDTIYSYFGLREIKVKDGLIYLNNKRIFLNGILDQGYYPEGIVTPPSYETIKKDIILLKELGFNTIRKHIKVEIPFFYYLCDKYGILVMQDFVNNGKYNFITQTALPTIGFIKKNDKRINASLTQRSNFIYSGERLVKYLKNHPSIALFNIFNEGWGQFNSSNIYHNLKEDYPDIIFNTVSGWFKGADSDLDSYHLYFKNIEKIKKFSKPIFISEFGALCHKVKDHSYSNKNVFAYTYYKDIETLEKEFVELYENKILPYKERLVGVIYTQLSDIEEEDNGLLTYDRKVLKMNKELIKNIINKLND